MTPPPYTTQRSPGRHADWPLNEPPKHQRECLETSCLCDETIPNGSAVFEPGDKGEKTTEESAEKKWATVDEICG